MLPFESRRSVCGTTRNIVSVNSRLLLRYKAKRLGIPQEAFRKALYLTINYFRFSKYYIHTSQHRRSIVTSRGCSITLAFLKIMKNGSDLHSCTAYKDRIDLLQEMLHPTPTKKAVILGRNGVVSDIWQNIIQEKSFWIVDLYVCLSTRYRVSRQ
jgi:hypothetical protein